MCFLQAAEHLQSFIADCDRRTELAKKRLAETQDEISAEVAAKVTNSFLTESWLERLLSGVYNPFRTCSLFLKCLGTFPP